MPSAPFWVFNDSSRLCLSGTFHALLPRHSTPQSFCCFLAAQRNTVGRLLYLLLTSPHWNRDSILTPPAPCQSLWPKLAPNFLVLCSVASGSLFLQAPWLLLGQFFSALCQLLLFWLLLRCLCSLGIHQWLSPLHFLLLPVPSLLFHMVSIMMPNLYLNVLCSDWPRYCISHTFQRVPHELPHRYLKLKMLHTELIFLLSKSHPLPTFASLVMYLFYPGLKLGTYYPHLSVSCIPTHRIKFSPKTENARASDLDSGSVLETALSPLLITAQYSTRQLQGWGTSGFWANG